MLDAEKVDALFKAVEATPGYTLTVDLPAQTVTTPAGEVFGFEVDAFRKHCLLEGLDDIGLTLQHADAIRAYELVGAPRRRGCWVDAHEVARMQSGIGWNNSRITSGLRYSLAHAEYRHCERSAAIS